MKVTDKRDRRFDVRRCPYCGREVTLPDPAHSAARCLKDVPPPDMRGILPVVSE